MLERYTARVRSTRSRAATSSRAAPASESTVRYSRPAPVEPPPPPVVAPIPGIKPLTGPGKVYDSASALWPGKGPEQLNYAVDEYVISGTAAGEPYETRLVIRKPKDSRKFSGLVVAEPMHPAAAAAHAFEYNSLYIMDAGHIADLRVMAFRESRGWEIRHDFFTSSSHAWGIRQGQVALIGQLLGGRNGHFARGGEFVIFKCSTAQFGALVIGGGHDSIPFDNPF